MKRMGFSICVLLVAVAFLAAVTSVAKAEDGTIAIVIHGGAGTIEKADMTPGKEAEYRAKLTEALEAGYAVLKGGASSVDAVEAAIRILENSPLFNAGRGAVFTSEGRNEMDASIMDGSTLNAGAVASVTTIKNPISAARKVMTESRHVMLVGPGAETFAREQGLESADSAYFWTKSRWEALKKAKQSEASGMGSSSTPPAPGSEKYGTVGCIALDQEGNIAAGTSTGGLTNKRWGRVGDSPIIGAGTYANNETCGVSGTGVGEYFMRGLIAYEVSAMMAYRGMNLEEAADAVLEKLAGMGGTGGFIALDGSGNVAMPFNTSGMYRGFIKADGVAHTFMYKDE
jgi:beta-aspartyl-peptidase (threonine type)